MCGVCVCVLIVCPVFLLVCLFVCFFVLFCFVFVLFCFFALFGSCFSLMGVGMVVVVWGVLFCFPPLCMKVSPVHFPNYSFVCYKLLFCFIAIPTPSTTTELGTTITTMRTSEALTTKIQTTKTHTTTTSGKNQVNLVTSIFYESMGSIRRLLMPYSKHYALLIMSLTKQLPD